MRTRNEFNHEVFSRGKMYQERRKKRRKQLLFCVPVLCIGMGILALTSYLDSHSAMDGAPPEAVYDGIHDAEMDLSGASGKTESTPDNQAAESAAVSYDFHAAYIQVNGSEDGENALWKMAEPNSELHLSSKKPFPVIKIASRTDLDEFLQAAEPYFSLDQSHGGSIPFTDAATQYDEAFFADHCLLLVYVSEDSGSVRHEVKNLAGLDGTLYISIRRDVPELCTDDRAGWLITLEVDDAAGTYQYINASICLE